MSDEYQALIDCLRDHQNGGRRGECEEAARAIESLRARLAAAESRLREYEDAPVVAVRTQAVKPFTGSADDVDFIWHANVPHGAELIIRPRGGKGE